MLRGVPTALFCLPPKGCTGRALQVCNRHSRKKSERPPHFLRVSVVYADHGVSGGFLVSLAYARGTARQSMSATLSRERYQLNTDDVASKGSKEALVWRILTPLWTILSTALSFATAPGSPATRFCWYRNHHQTRALWIGVLPCSYHAPWWSLRIRWQGYLSKVQGT